MENMLQVTDTSTSNWNISAVISYMAVQILNTSMTASFGSTLIDSDSH